ncbi:MAG: glycoside hydrolase, end-alpha-1,4-polygalactosaminidase [Actinobacteria bacterium]|nr:glycoside hydrolase, end-alpha-1,4-polygalactosaminidase [Actinomycetota bacterium]
MSKRRPGALALVLILSVGVCVPAGCESHGQKPDARDQSRGQPPSIGEVRTWAYQLQGLDEPGAVEALETSSYDMLVLEPTCTDWSGGSRDFDTAGMVERLKRSPAGDGIHRKLVLAYLDIGEAEDWRWYWTWSKEWETGEPFPNDWPGFILAPDPDGWEGNYPVAYWDPTWKDIMVYGKGTGSHPDREYRSALDEVMKHGFDGVYLDWVEAYEDPDVARTAAEQGVDAAEEMARLIGEINDYAARTDPAFLVVQQNAAALAEDRPETLRYIDAIAQEAIWYDGTAFDNWDDPRGADVRQDPDLTAYYLELLSSYKRQGIPVFDCEYADGEAERAYALSREEGFVPYCTRRPLSRLTGTPPPR